MYCKLLFPRSIHDLKVMEQLKHSPNLGALLFVSRMLFPLSFRTGVLLQDFEEALIGVGSRHVGSGAPSPP